MRRIFIGSIALSFILSGFATKPHGKDICGGNMPHTYVIDEEADSVFYRGRWYYDAHKFHLIDWVSKDGDYVMEHIILDPARCKSESLILADNGDTIARPGDSLFIHHDEYGDSIFMKRGNIYF